MSSKWPLSSKNSKVYSRFSYVRYATFGQSRLFFPLFLLTDRQQTLRRGLQDRQIKEKQASVEFACPLLAGGQIFPQPLDSAMVGRAKQKKQQKPNLEALSKNFTLSFTLEQALDIN